MRRAWRMFQAVWLQGRYRFAVTMLYWKHCLEYGMTPPGCPRDHLRYVRRHSRAHFERREERCFWALLMRGLVPPEEVMWMRNFIQEFNE